MEITWYKGGAIYYPKTSGDIAYCSRRNIVPYFLDGGCIPTNLINYLNKYIDGNGIVADKYLYDFDKLVEDNIIYNVYTNNLEPKDINNHDIFRLYNYQISNQGITLLLSYNTIAGNERYLPPEFQTQKPMPIHVEIVNTIKNIQDISRDMLTRTNNIFNIAEGIDIHIKANSTLTNKALKEITDKLPQVGAAIDAAAAAAAGATNLAPVVSSMPVNHQLAFNKRREERLNIEQEVQKNLQEFNAKRREVLDKIDYLRLIIDIIKTK